MKSYTEGRNLYGVWTKNASTANLTYGDQTINDRIRHICALKDWPFLVRTRTLSTIASTQFYNYPYDCDQVREISVVPPGSTIRYTPKMSPDDAHWDMLNLSQFTSDIPEWYFTRNGQIGLWPKPATSGGTITVVQKTRVINLARADYTTGNITTTSTTAGVTTVTGSGTSWSAPMVGRWLNITYTDTANTGDGLWYEIASVPSATTMTLVRAYGGTDITAGSAAYTIGQMSLLPEAFQDTPFKYAAWQYWAKEKDDRAKNFKDSYTEDIASLILTYSSPNASMVLDDGRDKEIINPNLVIRL